MWAPDGPYAPTASAPSAALRADGVQGIIATLSSQHIGGDEPPPPHAQRQQQQPLWQGQQQVMGRAQPNMLSGAMLDGAWGAATAAGWADHAAPLDNAFTAPAGGMMTALLHGGGDGGAYGLFGSAFGPGPVSAPPLLGSAAYGKRQRSQRSQLTFEQWENQYGPSAK